MFAAFASAARQREQARAAEKRAMDDYNAYRKQLRARFDEQERSVRINASDVIETTHRVVTPKP